MVTRTGTKWSHRCTKFSYSNGSFRTSTTISNKLVKRERITLFKLNYSLLYSFMKRAFSVCPLCCFMARILPPLQAGMINQKYRVEFFVVVTMQKLTLFAVQDVVIAARNEEGGLR